MEQQSVVENKMVALQRMGSVPRRLPRPHRAGKGAFIHPHGPFRGCLAPGIKDWGWVWGRNPAFYQFGVFSAQPQPAAHRGGRPAAGGDDRLHLQPGRERQQQGPAARPGQGSCTAGFGARRPQAACLENKRGNGETGVLATASVLSGGGFWVSGGRRVNKA